jgi:hypothetical protein
MENGLAILDAGAANGADSRFFTPERLSTSIPMLASTTEV